MKKKFCNHKKIYILVLICLYSILIFNIPSVYASTYTYTNASNDLPSDFDSLFPGYRRINRKSGFRTSQLDN